jgi:elongator complex protein 4
MSSFKRKTTSIPKQPGISDTGARSPSLNTIVSTGIPSLDDILGGGLPLSCSLLILAPDHHSLYGELIQKYFIAQGLASGQKICVIGDNSKSMVEECMWIPEGASIPVTTPEDDTMIHDSDDKIKIAWRYEQMKKIQTSIIPPKPYVCFIRVDFVTFKLSDQTLQFFRSRFLQDL